MGRFFHDKNIFERQEKKSYKKTEGEDGRWSFFKKKVMALLLVITMVFGMLPDIYLGGNVYAATATYSAIADTTIEDAGGDIYTYPGDSTIYGGNYQGIVSYSSPLKFDLSDISGGVVSSATLSIYIKSVDDDTTFNVYGCSNDSWSESISTMLVPSVLLAENKTVNFGYTGWVDIPLTDLNYINDKSDKSEVTFIINEGSGGSASFFTFTSKEGTPGNAPKLQLEYPAPQVSIAHDQAMTESNLDARYMEVDLSNETFKDGTLAVSNFHLEGPPAGLAVESVDYINDTHCHVNLAFDGTDFDYNVTNLGLTVSSAELLSGSDLTASNDLAITTTNDAESISISDDGNITEGAEGGEVITVTLSGGTFGTITAGNWTVSNLPTGVSKGSVTKTSPTTVQIALSGNSTQDYDSNITNITVSCTTAEYRDSFGGGALSANSGVTLRATNDPESISISDDGNIPEGAESGEVITVTLSGGTFGTITAGNWTVSGLPTGVSKGSVTKTSPTTLEIALSGNSTQDYNSDITNVMVSCTTAEYRDSNGGGALSDNTGVTLRATNGAQSATASANTLTPVVGADDAITLTVKNTLGSTDTYFDGAKNVTITGVEAAPNGTYGSFNGTALDASAAGAGQVISIAFTDGVAAPNLRLYKADGQTIGFSIDTVTTPATNSLNITPTHEAAASLAVTQNITAPASNGGAFAQQPRVTLKDAYGNTCTNDSGAVITASKKDAGTWTLTGTTTATASSGVATFTNLGATNAAQVNLAQLGFNTGALTEVTSVTVTLPAPAPASHATATAGAATLTPTAGVNDAITLTVKDDVGNTDTTFTGAHNVTVSGYQQAPDGSTYGSFNGTPLTASPNTISVTFTNGVATPNLQLNKASAQTIGFSIAGVDTPATNSLVVTPVPASASSMTVTQNITAPASNGGLFAQQPRVTLKDAYGNTCTNDSGAVITASKKDAGTWTLTGTATATASSGVATFTNLGATNAAQVNLAQLAFNTGALTEVTSTTVTLSAPVISEISAFNPISNISAGTAGSATYANAAAVIAALPTSATATANSVEISVPVTTWVNTDGYDPSSAGSYTFTATLGTIPTGYANSGNHTATVEVVINARSISSGGGGGSASTPATPNPSTTTTTEIIVNGQTQNAGTTTTTTVDNLTVTMVALDDSKVEAKLKAEDSGATVVIPVNTGSSVVVGQLNGQTVKSMESKDATLEIKTGNVSYTLPASEINIDSISQQIGSQVALKDITISIRIEESSVGAAQIVANTANKNSYQVVVKPVEFSITCTSGVKTVAISKFNGYVERTIAIPSGVDPSKITTGIVLNADGTFSHVPTTIVVMNGKNYAKINSLTNSTYSVIWNQKTFNDVENHWAKDVVNDMASRLIINGVETNRFAPEREITRAEFASIVVKGLGLMRTGTGKDAYNDVAKSDWYYDAVSIASQYGIVSGFGEGKFGPNEKITREQAMAMIARTLKITGLKTTLEVNEAEKLLAGYTDSALSSAWAKEGTAVCLKTGIVSGKGLGTLAPQNQITRAEVAVIIERLLKKSGLI